LSSLFNYLTKRKELRHNEYLKDLELKDKERERKFKIEEKMIDKSIDAHIEAFSQIIRIFGLVKAYYKEKSLIMTPEKKKELWGLISSLHAWRCNKGFLLEKTLREQIGEVVKVGGDIEKAETDYKDFNNELWEILWETTQRLIGALEAIQKEYNPLYDLNIKLPEIEIRRKKSMV
jgi:hypothetical protein